MQVIKMIKLTKIIFPVPSLMSATFRVVFCASFNVFSLTSIIDLQSRHIPLLRNEINNRSLLFAMLARFLYYGLVH